jgi:hypothetical protein
MEWKTFSRKIALHGLLSVWMCHFAHVSEKATPRRLPFNRLQVRGREARRLASVGAMVLPWCLGSLTHLT